MTPPPGVATAESEGQSESEPVSHDEADEAPRISTVDRREDAAPSVLVVDDEPSMTRLITMQLSEDGLRCDQASCADEALELLKSNSYDVLITDIKMPRTSGIELLKIVKGRDPEIQAILISAYATLDNAVEAIRSQVDDFLIKPFDLSQLSHAVARALKHRALLRENRLYREELERRVQEQAWQIEGLFVDGLSALAAAIEARDGYTGGHLDRVTRYSLATGTEMHLGGQRMWNLWLGSLFHDVGKLAIPDSILNKPGPLTPEEYDQMKKHPEFGVRIVERISFLMTAATAISHHQERWDGKGYPAGLARDEICIEGRILAVADAFDAMLSDRPYRKALTEAEAIAELKRCSGTQFDPEVVDAFLRARESGFDGQSYRQFWRWSSFWPYMKAAAESVSA